VHLFPHFIKVTQLAEQYRSEVKKHQETINILKRLAETAEMI
jgi:hypothetical protein